MLIAPIDNGEAYCIDAAEVYILLVNFIAGNETTEMRIKAHERERNGRID